MHPLCTLLRRACVPCPGAACALPSSSLIQQRMPYVPFHARPPIRVATGYTALRFGLGSVVARARAVLDRREVWDDAARAAAVQDGTYWLRKRAEAELRVGGEWVSRSERWRSKRPQLAVPWPYGSSYKLAAFYHQHARKPSILEHLSGRHAIRHENKLTSAVAHCRILDQAGIVYILRVTRWCL